MPPGTRIPLWVLTGAVEDSHKGHPISFMSDNVAWHHHVPTEAEIDGILAELEAAK